jgi:hypothetical protein
MNTDRTDQEKAKLLPRINADDRGSGKQKLYPEDTKNTVEAERSRNLDRR